MEYADQFDSAEQLMAALAAHATASRLAGGCSGVNAGGSGPAGGGGGPAGGGGGPAASIGGPAASSGSSAPASSSGPGPHGYGVEKRSDGYRPYLAIHHFRRWLPLEATMEAARQSRDAAVVAWFRYLLLRGCGAACLGCAAGALQEACATPRLPTPSPLCITPPLRAYAASAAACRSPSCRQ